MKPRIGFLDDDKFYAKAWVKNLEETCEVVYFQTAADALVYVAAHADLKCLVVDMMMPTPSGVSPSETDDGNETGLWFLRQADDYIRTYSLPILVLTNRATSSLIVAIEEMGYPLGLVEVRRKMETSREVLQKVIVEKITRLGIDS